MKVAMVKQIYDAHGPWASIPWSAESPLNLLKVWPGRALFWSMSVLLQPDWYVIPQQYNSWYTLMSGLTRPAEQATLRKYTQAVCPPERIPWDTYDVVISLDPCLRPPRRSSTLFAYYVGEHFDVKYEYSKQKVEPGYDLFLAHMLDAPAELAAGKRPQALAFPYLWETSISRALANHSAAARPIEDAVFVEWRTLVNLTGDPARQWHWAQPSGPDQTVGLTEIEARQLAARLEGYLGKPVRFRLFRNGLYSNLPDPPHWGEALGYLAQLASCRYYVSLFAYGPGQALVDAAAAGALVFGTNQLAYHRLACHPACLCANLEELPRRFRTVSQSPALQAEVLAWQDAALRVHFNEAPLALLAQAAAQKAQR